MRPIHSLLTLTAAAVFASLAVQAQEPPAAAEAVAQPTSPPANAPLTMPPASAPATVTVPARGSTMETVRAKLGAPSQEQPAIGQPPITRWDYPGYSIFFEHDKVLHTVVSR